MRFNLHGLLFSMVQSLGITFSRTLGIRTKDRYNRKAIGGSGRWSIMKDRYIAAGVFAAAMLLLLAHCSYKPPILSYKQPILADIRCASRTDCRAASDKFNRVVHAKYPMGSNQDLLDRDLLAQRFTRQFKGITRCSKRTDVPVVGRTEVDCPAWDTNWNPQHALWYWTCEVGEILCNHYAGVVWSS